MLAVVDFRENALVWGEPLELDVGFGGFVSSELPPEFATRCNAVWEAVSKAGTPRSASADGRWCIG